MDGYVGQPDSKTPVSVIPFIKFWCCNLYRKCPKAMYNHTSTIFQYHCCILPTDPVNHKSVIHTFPWTPIPSCVSVLGTSTHLNRSTTSSKHDTTHWRAVKGQLWKTGMVEFGTKLYKLCILRILHSLRSWTCYHQLNPINVACSKSSLVFQGKKRCKNAEPFFVRRLARVNRCRSFLLLPSFLLSKVTGIS